MGLGRRDWRIDLPLTKKQGEERDRIHEEIIQTGLMPDDVVGVSGTFSQNGDLFYVDDLHFPLQDRHEKSHAETGVSVAFLSDIHVGSKTFLEAQWHKMVDWFNTDPLAKTIKYLILSGDCVDGVGFIQAKTENWRFLICSTNTPNSLAYSTCFPTGWSA